MTLFNKSVAELFMVVYLTVEAEHAARVGIEHGLVGFWLEIDNGEPAKCEDHAQLLFRSVHPETFSIRATMHEVIAGLPHGGDDRVIQMSD